MSFMTLAKPQCGLGGAARAAHGERGSDRRLAAGNWPLKPQKFNSLSNLPPQSSRMEGDFDLPEEVGELLLPAAAAAAAASGPPPPGAAAMGVAGQGGFQVRAAPLRLPYTFCCCAPPSLLAVRLLSSPPPSARARARARARTRASHQRAHLGAPLFAS